MKTSVSRRFTAVSVALLLGSGIAISACTDDSEQGSKSTTTNAPTSEAPVADKVVISGAWGRTSPSSATAGAVYFTIENPTDKDDVLKSASVDASVAGKVELHESKAADDSSGDMGDDHMTTTTGMGGGGMGGGGMMTMQPVHEVPVPAGETVSLKPGGLHVMLMELTAPLELGSKIDVTLEFENAGSVVVEAEIRDTAP